VSLPKQLPSRPTLGRAFAARTCCSHFVSDWLRGGIASPDLCVARHSGSVPGSSLTLVVNEGGTVQCDWGLRFRSVTRSWYLRGVPSKLGGGVSLTFGTT